MNPSQCCKKIFVNSHPILGQEPTYRDAEERVPDHDLQRLPRSSPHDIIRILPVPRNNPANIALVPRRFVQDLQHVDHPPNLLCNKPDDVQRAVHVRAALRPVRVPAPPRVVEPVLRAGGPVEVEDDMHAVGARPAERAEEVRPRPGHVRRDGGAVVAVCGGEGHGPVADLHAVQGGSVSERVC